MCRLLPSYAWDDVIAGTVYAQGLTKPIVQIDLALMQVECIAGQVHSTTLFFESLLDSRKPGDDNLPYHGKCLVWGGARTLDWLRLLNLTRFHRTHCCCGCLADAASFVPSLGCTTGSGTLSVQLDLSLLPTTPTFAYESYAFAPVEEEASSDAAPVVDGLAMPPGLVSPQEVSSRFYLRLVVYTAHTEVRCLVLVVFALGSRVWVARRTQLGPM